MIVVDLVVMSHFICVHQLPHALTDRNMAAFFMQYHWRQLLTAIV
jgi:hypothetical protein